MGKDNKRSSIQALNNLFDYLQEEENIINSPIEEVRKELKNMNINSDDVIFAVKRELEKNKEKRGVRK